MGQFMSHPVEEKTIDHGNFDSLSYSVGSMQGYRTSMEDAHAIMVSESESLAVFGVFDGHGGKEIAHILRDRLVSKIFKALNKFDATTELSDYTRSVKDIFFEVDSQLPEEEASNCGSTAIVVIIVAGRFIIAANTGDSRSILSLPGGYAKTLSFDHKPSNMGERVRIENSGGYVLNSRVNEILALSRAFGDFKFKLPWLQLGAPGKNNTYLEKNRRFASGNLVAIPPEMFQVSAEPDILIYDMQALDIPEYVVLACDGIWDCYTNDALLLLIRSKLCEGWNLQHIVEYVLNDCISMASRVTGIGFDNMTLIIVALHPHSSLEQWKASLESQT